MFKKNVSVVYFPIGRFVSTADGSEVTAGTPTGTYSKDGTEGMLSGTIAYKSTAKEWGITGLTSTELNGDVIGLNFTLSGAVPIHYTIRTTTKLVSELVDAPAVATDGSLQVTLKSGTHTGSVIPTVNTVGTLTTNGDKIGYSLASAQSFSMTGNIAGNLSGSVGSVAGNVGGNVTGSIGSLGTQAKLDVNAEVDTALGDYDGPTNAEMTARTLAAAAYATAADQGAIKAKTDQFVFTAANKVDATATVSLGSTAPAGWIDASAFAQGAADKVWSTASRVLTAGTNIALAKGTGVIGFNDISAASVWGVARSGNQTPGTFGEYIDASVNSRLPTASYTAPPDAIAIRQEIDASSTKLAQLAGAFAGSTSVFTTAALANAPAGGGSGVSLGELQDELDERYLTTVNVRAIAAAAAGNLTESADHTTTSIADINDPNTVRITSVNTSTTRIVTVH